MGSSLFSSQKSEFALQGIAALNAAQGRVYRLDRRNKTIAGCFSHNRKLALTPKTAIGRVMTQALTCSIETKINFKGEVPWPT
jgi:hypothetical protein